MSLAATLLQTAVTVPKDAMLRFENRKPDNETSIVQAFKEYTEDLIEPSVIKGLKTSKRRPVSLPVLTRFAGTIGTVRQINPTPDDASSALVPINWITRGFSFKVSEAITKDTYHSQAAVLRNTMFNELMSLYYDSANSLEKYLYAFLETNKWATPPAVTSPNVTVGTGAYEVPVDDFMVEAPIALRENFINGNLQDIANMGAAARRRADAMHGAYNDENRAMYLKENQPYYSKEIVRSLGAQETHFLFPKGTVGLLNIVEDDAKAGREDKDGEFEVITDPFFGHQWGVYITKYRADQSGVYGSGQERSIITRYDFYADFAAFMAYSSNSGESPIVKFDAMPMP